jgi:hypothetical protein
MMAIMQTGSPKVAQGKIWDLGFSPGNCRKQKLGPASEMIPKLHAIAEP